ncbi:amidase family protein [Gayadomonas joobiniege]|uniref:amidase family protein n=1 Tax=Gayadomonas joobiniege TaxID=1234606 RepID=UPI00037FF495|nr:amidase family protein [Gayadomonas joobiniege]
MRQAKWPEQIYCQHGPKHLQTCNSGILQQQNIAVKDVFSIKGYRHAAGNPTWLATHAPATQTASSINKLLSAGAIVQSYVHTDELAYSLEGNNIHYGCAENPAKPGHTCGGSSMGCAAAVASGYAQIGLGTDTGGSIRVPACYTGLFGIRPSYHQIARDGLTGLAPEFDTIGWLTANAQLLQKVGQVLLPDAPVQKINKIVVCPALFELLEPACKDSVQKSLTAIRDSFAEVQIVEMPTSLLTELSEAFRVLQALNIADTHREWLQQENPEFAPAIAQRFQLALQMDAKLAVAARRTQHKIKQWISTHLTDDAALFLPSTPTIAPKIGADVSNLRVQTMQLTAICGLTGSCQVHLPLTTEAIDGPYGFSLLMPAGADLSLLNLAVRLSQLDVWK